MKENREYQLKVRLTNSEKERLTTLAAGAGLTISEYVRLALYHFTNKQMEVNK